MHFVSVVFGDDLIDHITFSGIGSAFEKNYMNLDPNQEPTAETGADSDLSDVAICRSVKNKTTNATTPN